MTKRKDVPNHRRPFLEPLFDDLWDKAATAGLADGRGGAEYNRVRAEWVMAGCPGGIYNFIVLRANHTPGRKGPYKRQA